MAPPSSASLLSLPAPPPAVAAGIGCERPGPGRVKGWSGGAAADMAAALGGAARGRLRALLEVRAGGCEGAGGAPAVSKGLGVYPGGFGVLWGLGVVLGKQRLRSARSPVWGRAVGDPLRAGCVVEPGCCVLLGLVEGSLCFHFFVI